MRHSLGLVITFAAASLTMSACRSSTDFCDWDYECPAGKVCLGSLCVVPPDEDADGGDVSVDATDTSDTSVASDSALADTPDVEACDDGATRVLDEACGLNGRGSATERCVDGTWSTGPCEDPDVCADDELETLDTACGLNDRGAFERHCVDGDWGDPVCNDPDACEDASTREDLEACGTNGRGTLPWTCQEGQWVAGACLDTDTCTDGESSTLPNTCGLNTRGTQTQRCESGAWVVEGCDDPDVCVDDEVQAPSGVCGLNDRGRVIPTCVGGQWSDVCSDPDECVDEATRTALCWQDAGTRPEACSLGRWYPTEGCTLSGVVRVSLGGSGELNASSTLLDVSDDGRYVLFHSEATNAVSADTNALADLFRYDLATGETIRVNVGNAGQESTDQLSGLLAEMSSNGERIVFASHASNLVDHDINLMIDVFMRDVAAEQTVRVSVDSSGQQANGHSGDPSISGDGRSIAFTSIATNLVDEPVGENGGVFLRQLGNELLEPSTTLVTRGHDGSVVDGHCGSPRLGTQATHVLFWSEASNLLDATPAQPNVYRHPAYTSATPPVPLAVAPDGEMSDRGASSFVASRDGAWIMFQSNGTNLGGPTEGWAHHSYVRSVDGDPTPTYVAYRADGGFAQSYISALAISDNGRLVVFRSSSAAGFDPDFLDATGLGVFLRNMETGTNILLGTPLAINAGHAAADALVTPDGRHVVFSSYSPDIVADDENGVIDVFMMPTPGYGIP